jgi:hypothetical protein
MPNLSDVTLMKFGRQWMLELRGWYNLLSCWLPSVDLNFTKQPPTMMTRDTQRNVAHATRLSQSLECNP